MCDGPLALRNRGPSLGTDDVLYMRTTAVKWNIAGWCGPLAELFFFLLTKDGKKRPPPSSGGQACDMTIDSCAGSTRMHRGRASPLTCKTALFDSVGNGPEPALDVMGLLDCLRRLCCTCPWACLSNRKGCLSVRHTKRTLRPTRKYTTQSEDNASPWQPCGRVRYM